MNTNRNLSAHSLGTSLPPFMVVFLIVAVSLTAGLFSASTAAAAGEDSQIEDTDLPYMALPVADLGDDFSGFQVEAFGGFALEENREPNQINSYSVFYGPADFGGPLALSFAATGAALFTDASAASSAIPRALEELRQGVEDDGGTFETFDVLDLADEAAGLTVSYEDGMFTMVLFRTGRLIGISFTDREEASDTHEQVVAIARTLLERIRGVVKGDVTELPGVLPPDLNCNGEINAIDATLLLQLSAALVNALRCDFLADANGDGRVNAVDATLILQFDAGLIFKFSDR